MTEYNQKLVGEQIKKYRYAKNYSQRDLAKLVGVSSGYIGDIERGGKSKNSSISMDNICKISEVLGVTLDDLAGLNLENKRDRIDLTKSPEIIEIEQEISTIPYNKLVLLKNIINILLN